MNLVKVKATSNVLWVTCCDCFTLLKEADSYADLDGEPFMAFYCQSCVEKRNENTNTP